MKKLFALCLAAVLCLTAASALAAGKLNVVKENFHTIPNFSTYSYAYAKVENSGDKAIKVNAGVLEIYDEAGEVITSEDYLQAYAQYLQPGEYTYVKMYDEIEEGANTPADYMMTLTGKSDNSVVSKRLPVEARFKLDVTEGWWEYDYMYATITNDTDEPIYGVSVVIVLLDAEGNILHLEDDALYNCAIMPGSSVTIREEIYSNVMEYFEANGMVPASADAIAYYEVEVEE